MLFFVYTKEQWEYNDDKLPVLVTLDRDMAEARAIACGQGTWLTAVRKKDEVERAIVMERVLTSKLGLDVMGMQGIF